MFKIIKYSILTVALGLINSGHVFAQLLNVDSMVHLLSIEKNDTLWNVNISRISRQYYLRGDTTNAILYAKRAMKRSRELNYDLGIAKAYANIAMVNEYTGSYDRAIDNYNEALNRFILLRDSLRIPAVLGNIANVYYSLGSFDKAIDINFEALKIFQAKNDTDGICISYNTMGNVFLASKDHKMAMKYFRLSLDLAQRSNRSWHTATALGNIGILMLDKKDYNAALINFRKTLAIREANNQLLQISVCYNNIGEALGYLGRKDSAEHFFVRSLEIKNKLGDKKGQAYTSIALSKICLSNNKVEKSLQYARLALSLSKAIKAKDREKDACDQLNMVFRKMKQMDSAYYYLDRYFALKEEIINSDTKSELAKREMKFNFDKRETELLNESKQKMVELRDQKIITYVSIGSGFLILLFFALSLKAYLAKNKANKLIQIQKAEIEEKHKEITDSINYAERIQRSFLATKELLDANLKDYFVFFQPKDVVSGDFYWASKLSNGNFALATADSTGHGVPGAIMSILNISCLENAVKEETEPSEILNHTRRNIIERLKKDGSAEGGKDGMDASLVCFDMKNKKLSYAAANNPVLIVRDKQIIELDSDKMPVGKHDKDQIPFKQQAIELQKDDVIYTLTDGMPDQFGGPKGKKFMYKKLKELLISISHLSMAEQKEILSKTLIDWKGELEQVDDICVIGIKL